MADAVGLLRPRTVVEPAVRVGGRWAFRFAPFPHVKLGVIVEGECWLALDGHEPVLLHEGDFYLLGNPPPYVLASDLAEEPVDSGPVWGADSDDTASDGAASASATYLCGGYFHFDDTNAALLIDILPTLVLVRAGDPRGKLLAHVSELLVAELGAPAAGSTLVLEHLAQMLFVHMLRAHADQEPRPAGWLGAFNLDGVGAALRAMHADVAHRWTLNELAGISHMSRSAFAASFKAQVGSAPLDYLIQWRMSLARDALRRDTRSISDLAVATGYESESAFSTAFRRVVGSSPGRFRDGVRRGVQQTED